MCWQERLIARGCWATAIALITLVPSAPGVDNAAEQEKMNRARQTFFDPNAPKEDRLAAAQNIGFPDQETAEKLLELGQDSKADDEVRLEALRRHPWGESWVKAVLQILNDPKNGGEDLNAALVQTLSQRTVRVPVAEIRQAIQKTYRQLLDDERDLVRARAYFALVSTQDPVALTKLVDGLQDGGVSCPVALPLAIEMIDVAGATRHFNSLRPLLDHETADVRAEAARVLSADAVSRPKIQELIRDTNTPEKIRVRALSGMARFDDLLSSYAIPLIRNSAEPPTVREAAMEAMVGQVNYGQLDDAVKVEFAEAVNAVVSDPTERANPKTRKQAATLLRNLKRTSPAIREYLESNN